MGFVPYFYLSYFVRGYLIWLILINNLVYFSYYSRLPSSIRIGMDFATHELVDKWNWHGFSFVL